MLTVAASRRRQQAGGEIGLTVDRFVEAARTIVGDGGGRGGQVGDRPHGGLVASAHGPKPRDSRSRASRSATTGPTRRRALLPSATDCLRSIAPLKVRFRAERLTSAELSQSRDRLRSTRRRRWAKKGGRSPGGLSAAALLTRAPTGLTGGNRAPGQKGSAEYLPSTQPVARRPGSPWSVWRRRAFCRRAWPRPATRLGSQSRPR